MTDKVRPNIDTRTQLGRLFQVLSDDEFASLVARAELLELKFGTAAFHEEDSLDHVYVMVAGKVRLTHKIQGKDETILFLSRSGEIFGTITAAAKAPYSVRASSDSQILRIPSQDLRSLKSENAKFSDLVEHDLNLINWQQMLKMTDQFQDISPENLRSLLNRAEFISLPKGEKTRNEWVGVDVLSIVLSGSLACRDHEDIIAGQYLYESHAQQRSASERQLPIAKTDCELLLIDSTRLRSLFHDFVAMENEVTLYKKRIAKKRDANLATIFIPRYAFGMPVPDASIQRF